MRFKNYLIEGRTIRYSGDINDTLAAIQKNCSNAYNTYLKTKMPIVRGLDFDAPFAYVDPKKGKARVSPYAINNFYTLLIDNLPSWSSYPQRSRSIVCSTNPVKAESYGSPYMVFPYNGYKIGLCPDEDIWFSFQKITTESRTMNTFANQIEQLINYMIDFKMGKSFKGTRNPGWEYLKKHLNNMTPKKLKEKMEDEWRQSHTWDQPFWRKWFEGPQNKTLMEYISKAMSPITNKFKLITSLSALPRNKECWTDSKCFLIHFDYSEKFIGKDLWGY